MKKNGLAPLVGKDPRILILGSLPGDESLRRQEYYGNPRNMFWQVIAGVYGEPVPETYDEKKSLLFKYDIALWDVCAAAEREGSLDSNIKNTEFNDLAGFIKKHPTIQMIVLNGGKAKTEYRRYLRAQRMDIIGREEYFFTSTSPLSVSAGWSLERIVEQWSEIKTFQCCIPLDLYPRIKGIEKVMRILGTNYEFHDSEVDNINISSDGTVILTIWSGWANNSDGEYLTTWKLNSCVAVDTSCYDPRTFWLSEMRIEADREWMVVILDGVGPSFTCSSIEVSIHKIPDNKKRYQ